MADLQPLANGTTLMYAQEDSGRDYPEQGVYLLPGEPCVVGRDINGDFAARLLSRQIVTVQEPDAPADTADQALSSDQKDELLRTLNEDGQFDAAAKVEAATDADKKNPLFDDNETIKSSDAAPAPTWGIKPGKVTMENPPSTDPDTITMLGKDA